MTSTRLAIRDQWRNLIAALGKTLQGFDDDMFVVLDSGARNPTTGSPFYGQVSRERGRWTVELASNAVVHPAGQLTAARQAELISAGWEMPGTNSGGNWQRRFTSSAPAVRVAHVLLTGMRIGHPCLMPAEVTVLDAGSFYRSGGIPVLDPLLNALDDACLSAGDVAITKPGNPDALLDLAFEAVSSHEDAALVESNEHRMVVEWAGELVTISPSREAPVLILESLICEFPDGIPAGLPLWLMGVTWSGHVGVVISPTGILGVRTMIPGCPWSEHQLVHAMELHLGDNGFAWLRDEVQDRFPGATFIGYHSGEWRS